MIDCIIFAINNIDMLYLHNIINGCWFIEESFAMNYYPILLNWITQHHEFSRPRNALAEDEITMDNGVQFASLRNDAYQISEYGYYGAPEDAPKNSVAIMTINGVITKYDQDCGPSGMVTKANLLNRCFQEDNIKAVILNIDSGGGEGEGMMVLQEALISKNKPVVAFVNGMAASAAYGISAVCDKIIANNNMALVGSIGTYMTIADFREYYSRQGIKLQEIYATKSTDKNSEYKEAINGNPDPVRKMCDKFNESFIDSIKTNRSDINKDEKTWSTGKIFFADEAIDNGLIDGIDSFNNVLNYFNT